MQDESNSLGEENGELDRFVAEEEDAFFIFKIFNGVFSFIGIKISLIFLVLNSLRYNHF